MEFNILCLVIAKQADIECEKDQLTKQEASLVPGIPTTENKKSGSHCENASSQNSMDFSEELTLCSKQFPKNLNTRKDLKNPNLNSGTEKLFERNCSFDKESCNDSDNKGLKINLSCNGNEKQDHNELSKNAFKRYWSFSESEKNEETQFENVTKKEGQETTGNKEVAIVPNQVLINQSEAFVSNNNNVGSDHSSLSHQNALHKNIPAFSINNKTNTSKKLLEIPKDHSKSPSNEMKKFQFHSQKQSNLGIPNKWQNAVSCFLRPANVKRITTAQLLSKH